MAHHQIGQRKASARNHIELRQADVAAPFHEVHIPSDRNPDAVPVHVHRPAERGWLRVSESESAKDGERVVEGMEYTDAVSHDTRDSDTGFMLNGEPVMSVFRQLEHGRNHPGFAPPDRASLNDPIFDPLGATPLQQWPHVKAGA